MTLLRRRILYLSFIAVFIIAGGIILFYLQGYRLNTNNEKWQIERTGAIQAESNPQGADILINGQIINDQTPATILSLRPADYEIKLNLNGFQSWLKTLKVEPSEVTFTGEVRLWPETNTGSAAGTNNIINSWLSPNGENLLYLAKPNAGFELWLLNLQSGQSRLLSRQSSYEIINLEWNSSSRDFLTQERSADSVIWRLYNLESNSWEDISLPAGSTFNNVHWGDNRNTAYAATSTELYEINLRTQSSKMIWREKIVDFRIHNELVYAITRNSGEAIALKLLNLSTLKNIPLTESPVLSTNVKFLTDKKDWLPLFDTDRHTLHLLNSPLTESKPVRTLNDITTFSWSAEDDLIITNNFEIWQYNFKDESPSFVERLSTTLSGAQKFGTEPYIVFFTNNEVWAIELDNRGERQRWLIGKFDYNVTGIFISPDYKTLTVQTTNDFYRLDLNPQHQEASAPLTDSPVTTIRKYLHLSNNQ